MLKSKYKIWQLLIVCSFCLLFFVIPIIFFNSDRTFHHKNLVVLFPVISLVLIYSFFQTGPFVSFDDKCVQAKYVFSKKTFLWSSVTDIFLSRKDYYLWQKLEAISIVFDNGEKLNLWQDVYSNCAEMRNLLSHQFSEKIRDPLPDIIPANLKLIPKTKYAGNAYTSFNTLLLVGMLLFMGFSFRGNVDSFASIIMISFLFILFIAFGTQMHYFLIDEGNIIIKNHYFPWINKQIRLEDIFQVDVETEDKRSNGLRIIMKDFESNVYRGGSLRNKNWENLLSDLKFIGIPGRDDR